MRIFINLCNYINVRKVTLSRTSVFDKRTFSKTKTQSEKQEESSFFQLFGPLSAGLNAKVVFSTTTRNKLTLPNKSHIHPYLKLFSSLIKKNL